MIANTKPMIYREHNLFSSILNLTYNNDVVFLRATFLHHYYSHLIDKKVLNIKFIMSFYLIIQAIIITMIKLTYPITDQ